MYLTDGKGKDDLGSVQPVLAEATTQLSQEIEDLGQLFLAPSQLATTKQELWAFAKANPLRLNQGTFLPSSHTPQGLPNLGPLLSLPLAPFRAMEGVDKTGQSIHEVAMVADRFSRVAEDMPNEMSWNMELLMLKTLTAMLKDLFPPTEPDPNAPKGRPFDILEYAQTVEQVSTAAVDLRGLLVELQKTVESKAMTDRVSQASFLLLAVFVVGAMLTVWRRGNRRQALVVGSSIVFFVLAATGQIVLVLWQIIHTPLTPSLFFLDIVAAMAYEMSRETLRAAQLSDDLREQEQRLDLAADSAGVGLWSWDFKTSLLWATERARLLYGFSLDEPIPFEKFLSKLHPDDLDWVVQASQKCLQEGVDFRHEYRIVLPDGSIRWFKVLAKAFLEPSGKPDRMTGVSLDITMPLLNGIDAIRHLTKIGAKAKIIVLTMHRDATYAKEAFDAGASGFVLKHAASSELTTSMHEVLRGNTFVSPVIAGELMQLYKEEPDRQTSPYSQLTARQREVLQLLAEGRSTKEVAQILHVSTRTVEFHKYAMMEKLHITSGSELVRFAIKQGIISI